MSRLRAPFVAFSMQRRVTLLVLLMVAPLLCASDALTVPDDIEAKRSALLDQWKARFEAEKLACVTGGPFVIAGDGGERRLAAYRDRTILAAQKALAASYFDKEPTEPILILLFESAEPYRRLAREWFGREDPPHFGYFMRERRVMLMNVGTGTGTLVHELVHALIAPDFPDVPDWFNEALASLYEQCTIDGETIRGLENWRLPALQSAIREGELRSLRELIEDANFYDPEHVGMNYAQGRYLLFCLQEKGLLRDYYKRFRDGVAEDPNGLKTLEALIAPQKLEEFEKDWRQWVLTLRFE